MVESLALLPATICARVANEKFSTYAAFVDTTTGIIIQKVPTVKYKQFDEIFN